MKNTVKTKSPTNLVLGRAGELVNETNIETYELIKDLFAPKGPYRKVLSEFGIGRIPNNIDFLVYKDNKVYADIEKENKALWESCMYKLTKVGESAKLKLNLNPVAIIKGIKGLIKKTYMEIKLLSNLEKTLEKAKISYRSYSESLEQAIKVGYITKENFLVAYENVVFITYLYELLYNFNANDKLEDNCLKKYVRDNDYLLKYDETFGEFIYRHPKGFYVSPDRKRIEINTNIKLIPKSLPECACNTPEKYKAEKVLQCLKNNARLKTNTLVYLVQN